MPSAQHRSSGVSPAEPPHSGRRSGEGPPQPPAFIVWRFEHAVTQLALPPGEPPAVSTISSFFFHVKARP